jgi:hypothetical protein
MFGVKSGYRESFILAAVLLAAVLLGLAASSMGDAATIPWVAPTDVETLGNPVSQRWDGQHLYARNVWDLQAFDGRIYIGSGNASNDGPAPNAGPVDIWSYDPKSGRFQNEFLANGDQIAVFRVVNGELMAPDMDPQESFDFGNLYRLRHGQWQKQRTIPRGVHDFDVTSYQGALFVAIGTPDFAAVVRSTDDGATWTSYPLTDQRAYTLFTLQGKLYVSSFAKLARDAGTGPRVDVWSGSGFQTVKTDLFPDHPHWDDAVVVRPVLFHDQLIYIGATPSNELQWTPFGLFRASSIDRASAVSIPFPEGPEVPYDIVVSDGRCYVLTVADPWQAVDDRHYLVKVWASDDLVQWSEVLRFTAPSFARSFEILDGYFYFGLGCQSAQQASEAGTILRIPSDKIQRVSEFGN